MSNNGKSFVEKRFLEDLFSFINGFHESDRRFVLAVSGGVDSMVMFHLFNRLRERLKMDFSVANLDHMIRKASKSEQSYIATLCASRSIPFYGDSKNIPELKQASGARKSLEQIAREERQIFLRKILEESRAAYIVTAHHRDDLIETFFMRLLKGTGLNGLNTLRKKRGRVLRPLLSFPKAEIEEYAAMHRIKFFTDVTNRDTKYLRNLIRIELIPFLRERFGNRVPEILQRDQKNLVNADELLEFLMKDYYEKCRFSKDRVLLDKAIYRGLEPDIRGEFLIRLYQRWLSTTSGIDSEKTGRILERMKGGGDFEIVLSEQIRFFSSGEEIGFEKREKPFLEENRDSFLINPSIHDKMREDDKQEMRFALPFDSVELLLKITTLKDDISKKDQKDETIAYLDFEKIDFPLKVRYWRTGDRFKPLGMKNNKRLSRFLTDCGISKRQKRKTLVVEDAKHDIIWCVGSRISEDYKITAGSSTILKFSIINRNDTLNNN